MLRMAPAKVDEGGEPFVDQIGRASYTKEDKRAVNLKTPSAPAKPSPYTKLNSQEL